MCRKYHIEIEKKKTSNYQKEVVKIYSDYRTRYGDRNVNIGSNLLKYRLTHLTDGRTKIVQTQACGEVKSFYKAGSFHFSTL